MELFERVIKPILFKLDPERAHNLTVNSWRQVQNSPWLLEQIAKSCQIDQNSWQPMTHSGITFPNPVGLAGGFDKQAQVGPLIEALGFGFATLGTTMPLSQPGNPKPRIHRLPEHDAIINAMGFNSEGVDQFRQNLEGWIERTNIPFGISLGRNKNSQTEFDDYVITLELVGPSGDYIEVNVSSPNTPGLRDLQEYEKIRELVSMLVRKETELAAHYDQPRRPMLVKFSPDMAKDDLLRSAEVCLEEGVAGFVATNTTNDRKEVPEYTHLVGGLSGVPLHEASLKTVATLRSLGQKHLVMGVGGVNGYDSAALMRDAGATVIQVYTSFIYHGPQVLIEARRGFQA